MKIISIDRNPSVINFTHCFGIHGMPIERIAYNESAAKAACRNADATCANDVLWTEKEHTVEVLHDNNKMKATIVIPQGFLSDGASLPAKMQWIVARKHRIAYLFHDFVCFYPDLVIEQFLNQEPRLLKSDSRRFADDLMLAILRHADGNSYHPRQLTFPILRAVGGIAFKNNMALRRLNGYS